VRAELLWRKETIEHIWYRHRIEIHDVEEAYSDPKAKISPARSGRQKIYGKTRQGRYLTLIVEIEGERVAWLVTAWEMTPKERAHYGRRKK